MLQIYIGGAWWQVFRANFSQSARSQDDASRVCNLMRSHLDITSVDNLVKVYVPSAFTM